MQKPSRVVILNIDGLRRDVFRTELEAGHLPHVERITGGREGKTAFHVDALSTAPSVTFTAQASIFTGTHPGVHGIAGNESFDRLGVISDRPRHYGFDVGETLSFDDAVQVFSDGLASQLLRAEAPTLYQQAAGHGLTSTVVYHMYARGAATWLPPNILHIARFTRGGKLLGLESGEYDARMLEHLIEHLDGDARPDLLTAYFMGLDHHSHAHGPDAQAAYLQETIDPQAGRLLDALEYHGMMEGSLFVLVSDHGQSAVKPDDRHSIRLGFPFDPELSDVFSALDLDVHDFPGEDPAVGAVVGANGGLAHVYLRRRAGRKWAEPPCYEEDILPVAEEFYRINAIGRYERELQGSMELILVRDAEHEGWQGPYRVYEGEGRVRHLPSVLTERPELGYVDAANRIRLAASAMTGDILLLANGREGFYFGKPAHGAHGGLRPEDSEVVFTLAYPSGSAVEIDRLRETTEDVISSRCAREGDRAPSVADVTPVVLALLGI